MSAELFDTLPIIKNSKNVFILQKESIKVISSSELTDEQKQKMLLANSGKVFYITIKIISLLMLILFPFIGLIIIGDKFQEKGVFYETLISAQGLVLTSIAYLIYFLLKKGYGRFRL
jgi:hypothetical protein